METSKKAIDSTLYLGNGKVATLSIDLQCPEGLPEQEAVFNHEDILAAVEVLTSSAREAKNHRLLSGGYCVTTESSLDPLEQDIAAEKLISFFIVEDILCFKWNGESRVIFLDGSTTNLDTKENIESLLETFVSTSCEIPEGSVEVEVLPAIKAETRFGGLDALSVSLLGKGFQKKLKGTIQRIFRLKSSGARSVTIPQGQRPTGFQSLEAFGEALLSNSWDSNMIE